MTRFEGKVAIVTGGAGGLGRATAVRLASEGAKVVLVDLDGTALEESASAVERAGPSPSSGQAAHMVRADVTRAADVRGYVDEATRRFGGVDAFFNNAGILGPTADLFDYPEDAFDRVLAVNAKGVWLGMREVAPAMRARGGGAIVNTASVAGLSGTPTLFAYGASKHAVVGMTKSAALTLAKDRIRVNAVCPTLVDTPMADELARGANPDDPESVKQRSAANIPLGRIGRPEDIASLVSYLLSDDASFITAAIYRIDGGGGARA